MTTNIGTLQASLFMETAAFIRDLKKAGAAVATETAKMRQHMARIEGAAVGVQKQFAGLRSAAAALGAALAVRQLTTFAKATLDFASTLVDQADAIGISVEALQRYRMVAMQAGLSTEALDKNLGIFVKNLGQLRAGTGALQTALKGSNDELLKQLKGAQDTEQALELFFKRLAEIPKGADRGRLAVAAFGKGGLLMANLVAAGFDDLAKKLSETIVLSEQLARAGDTLSESFAAMQQVFMVGFATGFITELLRGLDQAQVSMKDVAAFGAVLGSLVGKGFIAIAQGAKLVADNIKLIVAAMAAFIALKAAAVFVSVGAAVVKFSTALLAAARSGVLLDLILSKSIIGTIAKMAVAIGAAVVTWQTFGKDVTDAIKALEAQLSALTMGMSENGDAAADTTAKQKTFADGLRRTIENNAQLVAALGQGHDAYQALQDRIEATNDVTQQGIDVTTKAGQAQIALAIKAKESSRALEDAQKTMADRIQLINSMASSVGDSLADAFTDAALGAKTFQEALVDLGRELTRMLLNQALRFFLSQMIGQLGTPGGTGGTGLLGALQMHKGGVVGRTAAPVRAIPSALMQHAPRLHSGLRAGEFPAILQAGEKVTPRGANDNVTVIVNNNAPGTQATQRRQSTGSGTQIDVMVDQIDAAIGQRIAQGSSRVGAAMDSTRGLRRIGK